MFAARHVGLGRRRLWTGVIVVGLAAMLIASAATPSSAAGSAPAAVQPTFLRPFSADSLWYRPVSAAIAAGAFYGRGDGSRRSPGITAPVNDLTADADWILQGSTANPRKDLWTTDSWPASNTGGHDSNKVVFIDPTLRVPFNSSETYINAAAAYLTPDGGTWYEGNAFMVDPAGSTPYMGHIVADEAMTGRGTYGGRGGSGLSSVGGSLRPGELVGSAAISHALSVNAPMGRYGRRDAGYRGGPGYTTPAASADSGFNGKRGSGNDYSGTAFWMGSLLAIRPQDCATAKAAMTTQQGRNVAGALCTYGAYVTENSANYPAWEAWMFHVDAADVAASGLTSNPAVKHDLGQLLTYLYVVMDNAPPL